MSLFKLTNCAFLQTLFLCWCVSSALITIKNTAIKRITKRLSKNKSTRGFGKIFLSVYKIFSYSFIVFYGYLVLMNLNWIQDVYSYRTIECSNRLPFKIVFYYVYELSFYFIEIQSLSINYELSDRNQMLFHHITTPTLITVSYLMGYTRYGIVVMAIHDIADPFLETAKLLIYLKNQFLADIVFIIFTFVFIVSRLIIFPYLIIYPILNLYFETKNNDFLLFSSLLCLLLLMHFVWFIMICRVAVNIIYRKEIRDVRSESVDPSLKTD